MLKRNHLRICSVITALLPMLVPAPSSAAQRTFVSAESGNDANPCSRQLPCRQFTVALLRTDSGGEIVVLDSGGYGPLTISQSVTITAPTGVHAAITAFSGNAIDINAGSGVVVLRGLYLTGMGALRGIHFLTGKSLHIENCVVNQFNGLGIIAFSDDADVYITNTISRRNGSGFYFGASGGSIRANLNFVQAEGNAAFGVRSDNNSAVTVTHGVAAGHQNEGFLASSGGVLILESCTTTFNGYGIRVSAGTVYVANTLITANTNDVVADVGATTVSFGNNRVHGNTNVGAFTVTVTEQ
jgi:hypothetical protein